MPISELQSIIPSPQSLNLNYDDWRDAQVDAINWIEQDGWLVSRSDGKPEHGSMFTNRKIKVLEAPTGSGKTGIVLGLAALHPDLRFLVMTATKLEQEQFEANMTSSSNAVSIRGRSNFHCVLKHPEVVSEDICEDPDCNLIHVDMAPCSNGYKCDIKQDCGYFIQIGDGRRAQSVITNYAYGLSMLNYAPNALGNFDVIVCDEAHVLDSQLENFIKVELYRNRFYQIFDRDLPHFEEVGQWVNWIRSNWNFLLDSGNRFEGLTSLEMSRAESRDKQTFDSYMDGLGEICQKGGEWVVESTSNKVEFMPIWVNEDSQEVLFDHAKRVVLMSGTIPSSEQLAKKIGIRQIEMEFERLPWTFPVENRLIWVNPKIIDDENNIVKSAQVDMSFKHKEESLPELVDILDFYLGLNKRGEVIPYFDSFNGVVSYVRGPIKILIHTVSYNTAKYIVDNSRYSEDFFTHTSKDRAIVLEDFKHAAAPAVLISPSMDKAVDLPGKECELIFICKVPYPYLGSKVMKSRARQSQAYYMNETLMAFIQMAGRGVRTEEDVCHTIVTDSQIHGFLKKARRLIPAGIQEAIRR